jgi:hypothetical protein
MIGPTGSITSKILLYGMTCGTTVDPKEIENLVFTATKLPDSANRDTIQKYQSLLGIYESEKKKYDKVSERIDITVCQEFRQHYLGKHTVRDKLIALAESIQPNAKDQQQLSELNLRSSRKVMGIPALISGSVDGLLSSTTRSGTKLRILAGHRYATPSLKLLAISILPFTIT